MAAIPTMVVLGWFDRFSDLRRVVAFGLHQPWVRSGNKDEPSSLWIQITLENNGRFATDTLPPARVVDRASRRRRHRRDRGDLA